MGLDDWQYIYFIALQYEKLVIMLNENIPIDILYRADIDIHEQIGYLKRLEEILHTSETIKPDTLTDGDSNESSYT